MVEGNQLMDRFVRGFYDYDSINLIDSINRYAERNNLTIISLAANNSLNGVIVLFERIKGTEI